MPWTSLTIQRSSDSLHHVSISSFGEMGWWLSQSPADRLSDHSIVGALRPRGQDQLRYSGYLSQEERSRAVDRQRCFERRV